VTSWAVEIWTVVTGSVVDLGCPLVLFDFKKSGDSPYNDDAKRGPPAKKKINKSSLPSGKNKAVENGPCL